MNNDNSIDNSSPNITAGGDVIGVNVSGNKNVIGKNINIAKTNTSIQDITINESTLKNLHEKYSEAFKKVVESLNSQIKEVKDVNSEQILEIQKSLEDLAKESEDISPEKQPDEQKKKSWKDKFKVFAKYAVKALPKTAATLALFTPLTASFSKNIEEGLQPVVEGMVEAMK
jgi:hypothetical protein